MGPELGERLLREPLGPRPRPGDRAAIEQLAVEPGDLIRVLLRAGFQEDPPGPLRRLPGRPAEVVEHDQGPLALVEVAGDLLAVGAGVGLEVQDVVHDLERDPELLPGALEDRGRLPVGDQRAELEGGHGGVVGGLGPHHLEVVVLGEVEDAPLDPVEVEVLAVGGPLHQAGELEEHPGAVAGGDQDPPHHRVQGVAGVQREGDAVEPVEGRPPPALLALVLDRSIFPPRSG